MLTRLRVQGFKNLLDVDVRFGPFTCVAGRNAVGKSNLFDAIRFLHLLTEHPIADAARLVREVKGRSLEPRALFTTFGDFCAPEMRFTADLIVDPDIEDDLGVEVQASTSTLRYGVAFRLAEEGGRERLELAEETLTPVTRSEIAEHLGFPASRKFTSSIAKGRRAQDFISTLARSAGPAVKVHQEGRVGRRLLAARSQRTVVGGLASSDFPTILAVQREMQTWQTLLLEPSALRSPSPFSAPSKIDSSGGGIPAAIERLRRAEGIEGQVCATLANTLAELIDDVREVRVRNDEVTQAYILKVKEADGVCRPASSLSDGTLRFLALAVLKIDPEARGVICLEEPENGLHPERIPAMIQLLREIAVDPSYPVDADNPLRQVIVNTHSPVVIESVHPGDLVYFDELQAVREGSTGRVASVRVPPGTWRARFQGKMSQLAPGLIAPYLRRPPSDPEQAWLDLLDPDRP